MLHLLAIEYQLCAPSSMEQHIDFANADEGTLRYESCNGTAILRGGDMQIALGDIPLLDFAACLAHATRELEHRDVAEIEMTESERTLTLHRHNDSVEIVDSDGAAIVLPWALLLTDGAAAARALYICAVQSRPNLLNNKDLGRWLPGSVVT